MRNLGWLIAFPLLLKGRLHKLHHHQNLIQGEDTQLGLTTEPCPFHRESIKAQSIDVASDDFEKEMHVDCSMGGLTWVDFLSSPSQCIHISRKAHPYEQSIQQRQSWYVLPTHISKIPYLSELSASTGTTCIGSPGNHVWIIAHSVHQWGRCPNI